MKARFLSVGVVMMLAAARLTAAPAVLLEETFDRDLGKDWFWGLGTWTAKDGVLRGFESGPRRHGPVKTRRMPLLDGVMECEFRLVGKATFAGIIFNGSQERGHIVHLVMSRDQIRILAHPQKGETVELLKQPAVLAVGEWHRVRAQFNGTTLTAAVDGNTVHASHACIGEEKLTFGLGGDSGGPEGESAGALEFRALRISFPIAATGLPEVRRVQTGFQFTEGPAADARGNIYFSDLPTEKAYRHGTDGKLETFLETSLRSNGAFFHPDGRLLMCETGSEKSPGAPSRVVAYDVATKRATVLADRCDGRAFTRCNDLVPDAHGGIYFTDIGGSPAAEKPSGAFYCAADGTVQRLISDVLRCNGILLSADGRTLYLLPSGHAELFAYPVLAPGKLGPRRTLCPLAQVPGDSPRGGDGLTMDEQGNLYLTCPAAKWIQVVSPSGATRRILPFPEGPANCTFGGPDFRTLYVTAQTSLYAVDLPVRGQRLK